LLSAFLAGCDDGSSPRPERYLIIADSVAVGIEGHDRLGYIDMMELPEVHVPDQLAFNSENILIHIEFYKDRIVELGIDTVWINVGLWDATNLIAPQTPFDEYAANIEQIFTELLDFGVKVIWCETSFTEYPIVNDYVFESNIIADGLANDFGIPVFEMSYLQQTRGWELSFDGLHFSLDTLELIADEIEDFLRAR
jgi:lysophospholipase L1-like esterase